MDTTAYLQRIGYHGDLTPSSTVLRTLHAAHLERVPFENLDIHLGRTIGLREAGLFAKVVTHRRGGFCYELNGLFAWLLERLGFVVTRLSAGVMGNGRFGPAYDHLALLVALEEPWLVDVGFGQSFRDPLRLVESVEQAQRGDVYRLDRVGGMWVMSERPGDGDWAERYRFDLVPRRLRDFADRCRYHEQSPDSSFARRRVCSVATAGGRVTVTGMTLIETTGRIRQETRVGSDEEYRATLRDRFGVEVGDAAWRHPLPGGERDR